jgi:hypothetical protein
MKGKIMATAIAGWIKSKKSAIDEGIGNREQGTGNREQLFPGSVA